MHGLANGEIRTNAGKMDVFQSFDGPDTSYPDGLIAGTALAHGAVLVSRNTREFARIGNLKVEDWYQ
jgi:predicted nucleic acid-binding protein